MRPLPDRSERMNCIVIDEFKFFKLTGQQKSKGTPVKLSKTETEICLREKTVTLTTLQEKILAKNIPTEKKVEEKTFEFLKQKDLTEIFCNAVQEELVGQREQVKALLILACTTKAKNRKSTSTNLCVNDVSGSGKDFFISAVFNFFPKEKTLFFRRISEKALDYKLARFEGKDVSSYIFVFEDASKKILNGEAVKTIMSARPDADNIAMIVKDGELKELKFLGKPVMIFSSARGIADKETWRRLPFMRLDSSMEQTLAIGKKQTQEAANGKTQKENSFPTDFFNALENYEVVIPFADLLYNELFERLAKQNNRFHIVLRTVFPRLLDFIRGSAILHQYQRQKKDNKLLAEGDDYELARNAAQQTINNKLLIPISLEEQKVVELITKNYPDGADAATIQAALPIWEERWFKQQLDDLADKGFLKIERREVDGVKKKVGFYLAEPDIFGFTLPSWGELCKNNAVNAIDAVNAFNAFNAVNNPSNLNEPLKNGITALNAPELNALNLQKTCSCGKKGIVLDGDNLYCQDCYQARQGADI